MDDQQALTAYLRHGDGAAVQLVLQRYQGLVHGACQRLLGESSLADDASQETFAKLLHHAPQLAAGSGLQLGGWLYRTATTTALNLARGERAQAARERAWAERTQALIAHRPAELLEHLDEALARLPDEQQDLLVAHHLRGRSQTELADELGISQPAVKKRLDKAMDALRRELRRGGLTVGLALLGSSLREAAAHEAPAGLALQLDKFGTMSLALGGGGGLAWQGGLVWLGGLLAALITGLALASLLPNAPEPPTPLPHNGVAAQRQGSRAMTAAEGRAVDDERKPAVPHAAAPWADAVGHDEYGVWAEFTIEGHGQTATQRLRWCPPGTFTMGSPEGEPARWVDEIQREVTLTEGYWIADTECTQRLWLAVMGDTIAHWTGDDENGQPGLERPVEQVTHLEAKQFVATLAGLRPDLTPRLPTEAQWEYAARAGTTGPFSISPVSTDTINCNPFPRVDCYIEEGIDRGETLAVKSLPANPWGLYEVHGNVYEWCSDWYGTYDTSTNPVVDPVGPDEPPNPDRPWRVNRGGGYGDMAARTRSARRHRLVEDFKMIITGFRLVISAAPSGNG